MRRARGVDTTRAARRRRDGRRRAEGPPGWLRARVGPQAALTSYTVTADTTLQGITGLRLETLPDPSLPRGGPGRDGYGHFRVTGLRSRPPAFHRSASAGQAPVPAGHPAEPPRSSIRDLQGRRRRVRFEPADCWRRAPDRRTRERADRGRSTRCATTERLAAPGRPCGEDAVWLRGGHANHGANPSARRNDRPGHRTFPPLGDDRRGSTSRRRLPRASSARAGARECRPQQAQTDDIATVSDRRRRCSSRSATRSAAARKALADLQIPSTLVMKETRLIRSAVVRAAEAREFHGEGRTRLRRHAAALHPMRDDQPVNRLGLARWLVDERNPLVARVAVNRLWQQVFGRGLVETSEDFGTQGAPPSHPELLDWLATEFIAKRWSQKALLRLIVTSRPTASRRSSRPSSPSATLQPAAGPRSAVPDGSGDDSRRRAGRQWSAEREDARAERVPAAAGGHLEHAVQRRQMDDERRAKIVSPQPVHVLAPHVSVSGFMTFDATSREFCTVRRVRTNTPLQALTLLNDPASFEAARGARETEWSRPGADARACACGAFGLKLVVSRAAAPAELDRLVALYRARSLRARGRRGARRPDWRGCAKAGRRASAALRRPGDARGARRLDDGRRTCC